jgi:hypothetical protein
MKKLWIVLLLGALLVVALTGEVQARPDNEPQAWLTTTVPAGSFHPIEDGVDWHNNGYYIQLDSGGVECFTAPVTFPERSGTVKVKTLTLWVYDNNGTGNANVGLYRTKPFKAAEDQMGYVTSAGSSTVDPRTFQDTTIEYNPVKTEHGAYLWLCIGGTDIDVYGVKIRYTP